MKKIQIVGVTLTLLTIFTACNKSDVMETPAEQQPELTASTQEFEKIRMCTERFPEGTVPRAAVLKANRWKNGSTLTVSLSTDRSTKYVRSKVIQYAREWEQYANIKFEFVEDDHTADIRIAFEDDGSWSYFGSYALEVDEDEATMNFGWFNNRTSDKVFKETTLHEFGHALGLVHEHSHPLANIPWDKKATYAYYKRTEGWLKATVDQQVFKKYSKSQTNYSSYDKESIMHYSVDNDLTIGDFEVGWNTVLSPADKAFIAQVYPK